VASSSASAVSATGLTVGCRSRSRPYSPARPKLAGLAFNWGTAYIGSFVKLLFQSRISKIMLPKPWPNRRGLPQDGELPLPSLIFSDLL
jgi:hypothetical protein